MRGTVVPICLCLVLTLLPADVAAQRQVIVVNAEQPNLWTLEQAQHMLAQVHRRNLYLKEKSLKEPDPNEAAGLRFDVMRTLVEIGATFDQAYLATNDLLSASRTFNSRRHREILAERDRLRREALRLTGEVGQLQIEKEVSDSGDTKKRLAALITATPTATAGGAAAEQNRLPQSTFGEALKGAAAPQIQRFNQEPGLNASLRLDNFLKMQYEIISKHLALLRDEIGPGERFLFLELPQTLNAAHRRSKGKWAQSWWRVIGYTKLVPDSSAAPAATTQQADSQAQQAVPAHRYREEFVNLSGKPTEAAREEQSGKPEDDQLHAESVKRAVRTVGLIPAQRHPGLNINNPRANSAASSAALSTLFGFRLHSNVERGREQFTQFVLRELCSAAFGKGSREFGWTFTPMPGTDRLQSGVRTTYAAVVVPEEATSIVLESNSCYFPRSFNPPNNFEHTTTAEWNLPDRTSRNCGVRKVFVMRIPSAGSDSSNNFLVEKVSYQRVAKNERIVVTVSGKNFSSQIGVLVNGVPLAHAPGFAQTPIRDASRASRDNTAELKGEKVRGRVERVDADKIVFSFEVPDFKGTPVITLVAPGKALDINRLHNLTINGHSPATMLDSHDRDCDKLPRPRNCVKRAAWMFSERPQR